MQGKSTNKDCHKMGFEPLQPHNNFIHIILGSVIIQANKFGQNRHYHSYHRKAYPLIHQIRYHWHLSWETLEHPFHPEKGMSLDVKFNFLT